MSRRETLDQLRRVLALAASVPPKPTHPDQLELPFGSPPRVADDDTELAAHSDCVHDLILELVLAAQMELSGLVASPVSGPRRRRVGLGAVPPLRLLEEWEQARPTAADPWELGLPAACREGAYAGCLSRIRDAAEACELNAARLTEIVRRLYPLVLRMGPEEDLPGLVHGHAQRYGLRLAGSGRLAWKNDRLRGRSHGAIHTPLELAAELTRVCLRIHGRDGTPSFLDPACGSGQFLMAAASALARRQTRCADGKTEVADCSHLEFLRHLYGVDLDPRASRIAAWNLSYWAALRFPRSAEKASALDELLGLGFPYFLGRQIQVGNALQIEASPFSPGFLWERRFPEVFQESEPGFDMVVGNPPWVSYGLRNRVAAPEEERVYYERLFPAGTQYKLSLYPIFMELAIRLCRPGGVQGFLVPDSILAGHHFSRIRRLLLTATELMELTLIEAGTWPGVHVGHTLMYAVRKKKAGLQPPVSVRNRILEPASGRAASARRRLRGDPEAAPSEEGHSAFVEHAVWVPSVQYSAAGSAPLRIFRDAEEMAFLSRIQSGPLRFRDVAWTYSGLIGRFGQHSIQGERPLEIFELRDPSGRLLFSDTAARERWRPALLSGGEVTDYHIRWVGGHVYWPQAREDLVRLYKSGYDLARYEKPKVFLRQTGDHLTAAVDRQGLFCLNNLHLVGSLEQAKIPPLILAGMLMSGPVRRAYGISSLESSRPLAQVDLKTLESLPYPCDSSGAPIGSGAIPPRTTPPARKVLRSLDRAHANEDTAAVLELAEKAWRCGAQPMTSGSLTGREALSLLLLWFLERLESAARASATERAARQSRPENARPRTRETRHPDFEIIEPLFDEIVSLFFQLSTATTV